MPGQERVGGRVGPQARDGSGTVRVPGASPAAAGPRGPRSVGGGGLGCWGRRAPGAEGCGWDLWGVREMLPLGEINERDTDGV